MMLKKLLKKNLLWLGIPVGLLLTTMGLGWTLNEYRFILGGAFFLIGGGMALSCMHLVGLLRGAVVMPELFHTERKVAQEKKLACEYITVRVRKQSEAKVVKKSTYVA